MENASKALLMAGGVLIAMLIITTAIILFNNYKELGPAYERNISANEIKKFNANFTKFEGRKDIIPQEIVTLINFAEEYKNKNEIEISINIEGLSSNNDYFEFIEEDSIYKFDTIKYDAVSGRVSEISFKKTK